MAEAFITAIHSASEEANSPKAIPFRSDKKREIVSQTDRKSQKVDEHDSVANHDNDIDDAISLQPDRDERRGLDLDIDSDNESQQSSVNKNRTHNRFQRYSVVDKDSLNNESVSRDILGDIFGEDAKTKPDKSEGGIVLDQSQINILNQSWHCDNPLLLKATLLDTGLEDITDLNNKFLSLKLSSDGVLGKDFEEKLKNRSETNKQMKDLLPELNLKTQIPKVAKHDFSNFRIPKMAAKPSENKGGFKPNFRRLGSGRQEADGEKKGSFRGNGRPK
ncbi:unnamed protein product [Mytilus coruscus]|uniref:Uncharacterized protein n=1 Tax=Mytilus coruscus TaxID=42192 RepID=A0A6J8EMH9_MYTCO|nr:unnamed protein product [Mytilus coruscus]